MKMNSQTLYHIDGSDSNLVTRLLDLPHKILSNHESNDLAQMVLHELGHDGSFGLNKAGYLVDNPDFNCLKGIAGYHKDECQLHSDDIWTNPVAFSDAMKNAQFHQQLATFYHNSLCHKSDDTVDVDAIKVLSGKLGMYNPAFLTWKMKHGNHGILLFEDNSQDQEHHQELLQHVVALLGLC